MSVFLILIPIYTSHSFSQSPINTFALEPTTCFSSQISSVSVEMVMSKFFLVAALVLLAVLTVESKSKMLIGNADQVEAEVEYQPTGYGPGSLKSYQCSGQCQRRCKQTQYKKPCLFFCNKCCNTCLCVPPGFYGNKGVCPCYNNWKTKRGGPKCP